MTRYLFWALIAALFLFSLVDAFGFARKRWKSARTRKELLLGIAWIASSINFFAFLLIDDWTGDALNGKVEGGHYYLGGNHGPYEEVSRRVFVYSAFHATVTMLGMIAVVAAGLRWKRKR